MRIKNNPTIEDLEYYGDRYFDFLHDAALHFINGLDPKFPIYLKEFIEILKTNKAQNNIYFFTNNFVKKFLESDCGGLSNHYHEIDQSILKPQVCGIITSGLKYFTWVVVTEERVYVMMLHCINAIPMYFGFTKRPVTHKTYYFTIDPDMGEGIYGNAFNNTRPIFTVRASHIAHRVHLLLFKDYAEVETIIVNNKNPKVKSFGEKTINESNVDVKLISSNWFYNIVRTEGFNVRGHFRLQPCGEGMQDRKLIYINDFQKHGYKRKAQKEMVS